MATDFVLDNSIVMTWCFEDEISSYAESILDSFERSTAKVPSIWPLEVGNVLLVAERRKRLSEADSARFLTLLNALPIQVEQETPERMTWEIMFLARELKLSTYDASYLDLAMREGLPLATLDKALRKAARHCKVQVV